MKLLLLCTLVLCLNAAEPDPAAVKAAQADCKTLITGGRAWLLSLASPDGAISPDKGQFRLGMTILAVEALTAGPEPLPISDPVIAKALAYIDSAKQADGGVYFPSEGVANYCTSLTLLLDSRLRPDAARLKSQQDFILKNQVSDPNAQGAGGWDYAGSGKNADLSNGAVAVEALKQSGVPADHPQMQAALKFIEKCQNLSSANPQAKSNDGGATYTNAKTNGGGSDQPSSEAGRTLESYGSMTYAMISSYIYLDLQPDDPRLLAAESWALQNYQFDSNPGMTGGTPNAARAGLFYYFTNLTKTFALRKLRVISLPDGSTHDWRVDYVQACKIRAQQIPDSAHLYWINDNQRWSEGAPLLCTVYALRGLNRAWESMAGDASSP